MMKKQSVGSWNVGTTYKVTTTCESCEFLSCCRLHGCTVLYVCCVDCLTQQLSHLCWDLGCSTILYRDIIKIITKILFDVNCSLAMAISKDRMEKELAAQKYRAEKIEKEALAQKKKAETIAHLETQGQRVEGVIGFTKKLESKTSDNTLALLLSRKAVATTTEAEKVKEQQAKATLIKQQDDCRRARDLKTENESLPPSWQSVFDDGSKTFYYWNRVTNETSWTKPDAYPEIISVSGETGATDNDVVPNIVAAAVVATLVAVAPVSDCADALLSGWEERKHPATLQSYYVNLTTNESRYTMPTLLAPSSSSSGQNMDNGSMKRSGDQRNAQAEKLRRLDIDPLDVSLVYLLMSHVNFRRHSVHHSTFIANHM